MKLSEAALSHLAHRAVEILKKGGAKFRNERLALAQVKKTLARHLERDLEASQRRMR